MPLAIIEGACPNCNGSIDSERLKYGLPCKNCLPLTPKAIEELKEASFRDRVLRVKRILTSNRAIEGYWRISEVEVEIGEFEEFFKRATGRKPWSAQKTWTKRLLLGESFAIIAPTGVGKTTFISIYSLYHVLSGGVVYIIVPTGVLVRQVYNLLITYSERLKLKSEFIVAIHAQMSKNDLKKAYEKLISRDYKIVVTTSAFLSRNFPVIRDHKFTLVFVDDVDALLRKSKNVDRVLQLIGFSQEIVDTATRLVLKKLQFYTKIFRGACEEEVSRLREEIESLREKIDEFLARSRVGQLVIASATGRSKGLKAKVFRELLGFEAGNVIEYFRNIVDVYEETETSKLVDKAVEWILKLKGGGLVFVAQDLGLKTAEEIVEKLKSRGVRAALASSKKRRFIEDFSEGKIEVLVGVASYYGVIVRGLDLPHRIRYAIFVGVPKFQVELSSGVANPLKLLSLLIALIDCLDKDDEIAKYNYYLRRLRRIVERLSFTEIQILRRSIIENIKLEGYLERVKNFLIEVRRETLKLVKEKEILEKLRNSGVIVLREVGEDLYLVAPDPMTYIQASGRTSRMFANGMSKGLSIVLVDDRKAYEALNKQLRYYIDSYNPVHYSKADLDAIVEEIDKDRSMIVKAMKEGSIELKDPVKSALLVVESPTKAKTIASFFGKPSRRRLGGCVVYEVILGDPVLGTEDYMLSIVATKGHILDLTSNPEIGYFGVEVDEHVTPHYTSIKKCKVCRRQFTYGEACPSCNSNLIKDSREVIYVLRKLAQEVDCVFIGTDPDSEGEKIAWDVYLLLKPYVKEIKRVEFHEVTRRAVIEAILNPRDVNVRLVEAQIVRRVEDRWVGFELSQRLWRAFGKKWLSAGRVQTPVLGWAIKRLEEWKNSKRKFVLFKLERGVEVVVDFGRDVKVEEVVKSIGGSVEVVSLNKNLQLQNPLPPYTTESILYDASKVLNLDVSTTMKMLQLLFESGFITYHRTDSTRVSNIGIGVAKEYISSYISPEYFYPRSWGEGGAHECIRPTRPLDSKLLRARILDGSIKVPIRFSDKIFDLYNLIFKRFIASQMTSAEIVRVTLELDFGGKIVKYEGIGEVLKPGFMKVIKPSVNSNLLSLKPKDRLSIIEYRMWNASLYPLYKPGDLVKLMKEKGIGRPSTYSKTLEKLRRHGYIIVTKRKFIVPTKSGLEVYEYLKNNYPEFISEEFTRELESVMEGVEKGIIHYEDALRSLYDKLTSMPWSSVERKPQEIVT